MVPAFAGMMPMPRCPGRPARARQSERSQSGYAASTLGSDSPVAGELPAYVSGRTWLVHRVELENAFFRRASPCIILSLVRSRHITVEAGGIDVLIVSWSGVFRGRNDVRRNSGAVSSIQARFLLSPVDLCRRL